MIIFGADEVPGTVKRAQRNSYRAGIIESNGIRLCAARKINLCHFSHRVRSSPLKHCNKLKLSKLVNYAMLKNQTWMMIDTTSADPLHNKLRISDRRTYYIAELKSL